MASHVLEGREILVSRLQKLLGTLVHSVEIAGQNNLSSSHVVAETTMLGLLNRIYGWELVNANAIRQNFPGVDLIDENRNIAVQVTATRTAEKVRHTLEEVAKSGESYDKLIVLILTNMEPTDRMRSCTVPNYTGPMKVWNIPDVFRDAMELDPLRLDELVRFLEAEVGTIRERVSELPHLELPPATALPATGFVGREDELAEIRSRFAQGDRMVVLTGLGGMGKTELAVRFGQEYPGLVYFVRFDTNFTQTLANMVHGIRPKLVEADLRLEESILIRKVQLLLERSSPDDLLIIDNADSDTGALADLLKDPGYKLIQALPLKLLITTRSEASRPIPVVPMPEEPLFRIFRNHGADLTEQQMCDLIKAVNGHTLTIDLIARTLADNWVPIFAQEMLDAVRNSTLSEEDFPEVGTDYNGDVEQLHIYQRLKCVFQVAKIPPVEQQILRCATLLPIEGMDIRLFRDALPPELRRAFPGLGRRGWLSAANKLVTIHPVVRLICLTELKPTGSDCEPFLENLWTRYDPVQYRPDQYDQMAELFTLAHDRLGEPHCRWLNYSGILLNAIVQPKRLHDLYHPRLPALEAALPPNSTDLATAYNYFGISVDQLGHYSDALTYGQKALTIQQAELPEDNVELAYSYHNVGNAHCRLGDYRTALAYQLKAHEILKNLLPPEHPDLARSYDSVGYTHGQLGDHRKELEYQQKALAIREKALLPEHPSLAASYNNVGSTYGDLGDHRKALEYQQKALAIREKALPPEHPDLASSYASVGYTHGQLGDHRKALEYKQKALAICEKALPPEHPDLALSYNNMGSTYGNLGDHRKELEYLQKALAIWEKALPPEHPSLALSYNNIAWTYHTLGDFQSAARFMSRAAEIIGRSSLPKTHPNRINYPKWAAELAKKAEFQRRLLNQPPGLPQLPFPFPKK